ncbi:MAG: hypothetical protein VR68_01165 [Peptococcaceae bacterium BRH_c4a]|nr:MAG: hypothetical protein VR68_07645 [Peptococcaceae bacterium BRH_c4a]KJS03417.1 MAG: hypothetical protein VR68_01165 [Peptococcaceae bacterium BRH_c4a]
MTQAYAWQQPQPPGAYLNPNDINANNPDPLTGALSNVAQSPFSSLSTGLPKDSSSKPASVDIAGGMLNLSKTDLKIQSNGFPLTINRTYSSGNTRTGPFGSGWDFTYNRYIMMYAGYTMLDHRGDQGTFICYNKKKQLGDEDDKVRKKTKFNRDLLHSDKG